MIVDFALSEKQIKAYDILQEPRSIELVFGGGARGGKAQPLWAKVLTPDGFVEMGRLGVGDLVVAADGKSARVIGVYPQGAMDIFKISFSDGSIAYSTKDHLWDCWPSRRPERRRARTLHEIMKLKSKVFVPLAEPLEFGVKYEGIDPYILGVLLGDGCLRAKTPSFTTLDKDLVELVSSRLPKRYRLIARDELTYAIICGLKNKLGHPISPFIEELKRLGMQGKLSGDKSVPRQILNGDLYTRLECLRGLMDTDGTVDLRGHVSFCSKSKQLALDVQYLARSIGAKASIIQKLKHCTYKGERKACTAYEVYIRANDNSNLFHLTRKKNRTNRKPYEFGRRIEKIEYFSNEPAQCIAIDHPSHLYITDDFVVTHNTYLGSFWIISECLAKPGSAWLIAREELKALKRTTLRTFFQVLSTLGLKADRDFKFNSQDMTLTFYPEKAPEYQSVVFFAELKETPGDPEFDRIGSYDLTGAWLDEAQEISKNAKDVLQFRFTVLKKNGWEAWPKCLYTCNPGKNWIYSDFWKPLVKDGKENQNRYFITSLYTDNPEIDHEKYRESVSKTENKVKIERLLYGNFEYDETPGRLCDYDAICEMFRRKVAEGEQYLTVDVAREGDDRSVVKRWKGFQVKQIWAFPENTIDELIEFVRDVSNIHLIPMENVVADAVGVGAGLVDVLRCKAYVGNRSPIQPKEAKLDPSKKLNFKDLNAQCGSMLADKINKGEIGVDPTQYEELLKEELDNLLIDEPWADKPLALVPKDEIKSKIGRSPDFRDALMMRMYFELIPNEHQAEESSKKTLTAMQSYLNRLKAQQ